MQAQRLRYWREQRMLTMRELAEAAGVSLTTVNRLEHGKPGEMRTLRRLAEVLKVNPRDLVDDQPAGAEQARDTEPGQQEAAA